MFLNMVRFSVRTLGHQSSLRALKVLHCDLSVYVTESRVIDGIELSKNSAGRMIGLIS